MMRRLVGYPAGLEIQSGWFKMGFQAFSALGMEAFPLGLNKTGIKSLLT